MKKRRNMKKVGSREAKRREKLRGKARWTNAIKL